MKTVAEIRRDFPILNVKVNGRPLVYLDSAASSQKPMAVLDSHCRFCESRYSNVHRGVHTLGERATADYEAARGTVRDFIKAPDSRGVIFTRGTTESINLVAHSFGRRFIKHGQAILLTPLEHHANLVPWQIVAKAVGAELRFWPLREDGTLDMDAGRKLLDGSVALVALTHVSNVLGTINPVREITELAHRVGARVLVDGAQAVPHMPVDITEIDADFYAFSGHKMLGPTGIGVLWGKPEILEDMDPFLTGGEMIREVFLDHSTWNELPYKFEAGTPPIVEAVGLAEAIRYLDVIGMDWIHAHDYHLSTYAYDALTATPGVTVYGPALERSSMVTFNIDGVHAHDAAGLLDREGIAIRAGHHCAQPLMRWLGVVATARASFYLYNTEAEIDLLVDAVRKVRQVLSVA
ncbi:cysteine desulfurase [candidate division KSB1 bacterium]|nr:cysteine desulfurase [candidate division KSB1 bacterium]